MNQSKLSLCIAVTTLLFHAGVAKCGAAEPGDKPSLQTISWLAGEWSLKKNGRVVTEIWMPLDGGTMLGMSRTVANGETLEYESLLLRQDVAGDVFYIAKPSGQPEASFKLTHGTTTIAVFENPRHDFPQRISYTLRSDGTILAAIEGQRDDKTRRVEFLFSSAVVRPLVPAETDQLLSSNKQTVQKYMDAFHRSNHEDVLACLTDDVEWVIPGIFHKTGKDAFDKEIENEAFIGSPTITVTRMTEENDVVVVEGKVRSARKDGGVLNAVFCDVFELRDAKIKHLTSYLMEVKE